MKKKARAILLIVLMSIAITGCYNYRDINNATFTTSVVFDVDPLGNVVIYMDCVKPYRNTNESSDNGKRTIYKGTGKTALEAIRDVNMASSYKVNFTQNRAIIFTEGAAKKGLDKFLDLINNDQEFQVKPYVFVYFGDVEQLLKVTSKDQEYLGLFLNDLVQKNKANPRAIIKNINEYITESEIGTSYSIIGGLELRKDVMGDRIELSGGVIMKNNVMQEKISVDDGLSYNILANNIKTGTLEAPNPQMKNGFITLEILNNKTKTDIKYDGNVLLLTKKINMDATLAEAQGRFIVDKEALETLKTREEVRMKTYLLGFFDKYNKKNIDIMDVERLIEIKYPHLIKSNILSILDIRIDINLNIEGTSRTRDSFF